MKNEMYSAFHILPLLFVFAPAMFLVLLGSLGKRVHVKAIYAVGIYTLAWGVLFLVLTLAFEASHLLGAILLTLACAAVGGTLVASKRDMRLAKLSAALAIAATLLFPFLLS